MPNIMLRDKPLLDYHRSKDEEQRLRRLAEVRSVINPHGRRALPPPVRTMKEPPIPRSMVESASTPSFHEFATRTHLARLDVAYEKLDAFVEQSVLQLQSGIQEEIDKLRAWVESRIGMSEEKLAEALTTVQSTRSVLDSAVSSLSAAQGGKNGIDELRARIASCEERLVASANNSAEIREQVIALDERWAKEILGSSPKALVERLRVLEVLWGAEILEETAPKALTERFKELEVRMFSILEERLAAKALEDEAPKATDHHESFLSFEVEARVKVLEEHMQSNLELAERIDTVSENVNQCKTALEFAVGDLAKTFSDQSITKDMNGMIDDARFDHLQGSINDVRAMMDVMRLEQIAIKDDLEVSFASMTEFKELKAVSEDLKLRQESVSTIFDNVARRLQVAFDGKVESEDQESDATVLSQDARSKSFEVALSRMASSVSSMEQKLAGDGAGISLQKFVDFRVRVEAGFQAIIVRMESARYVNEQEDRVGDTILQHFIYTLDERIREIQTHVNKNGHYVEKLMAKVGLKVIKEKVNSRCECGAEFNPDYAACVNCGEPWKAQLHEALRTKREQNRLKKYAREFLSNKDCEIQARLVFVAFDVWARGSEARSLKCYSEAHPRDPRVAYQSRIATNVRQQSKAVASSGGTLTLANKEERTPPSRRTPPSIDDSALSPASQSLSPSPIKGSPRSKLLNNSFSASNRSVGSLPPLQEQG